MTSILTKIKPDAIGSLASTLCLIHCIATPFIFITQACTMSCCADAPIWWQSIDYIFIIISFFAIYKSTTTSTKLEYKDCFVVNMDFFFILILNKTIQIFYINNNFTFAAVFLLAILHLYNLRYCQCSDKDCCATKLKA